MGKTKSSRAVSARERARQARLRIDAEREERDRKIEETAAAYFTAADEHAEVTAQLEAIESRMRDAVIQLLDLGETKNRVAALLGIETRDVRRMRTEHGQASTITDDERRDAVAS